MVDVGICESVHMEYKGYAQKFLIDRSFAYGIQ